MAEDDGLVGGFALGQAKPRQQAVGYVADFPFELKVHRAVGRADAHAGEGVDDDAQAFGATQRIFPVVRRAAKQGFEVFDVVVAREYGVCFMGMLQNLS